MNYLIMSLFVLSFVRTSFGAKVKFCKRNLVDIYQTITSPQNELNIKTSQREENLLRGSPVIIIPLLPHKKRLSQQ